ncbi:hypothetical protein [Parafrankia sp. BMG5.11]|uniref:hypothetical protein n=1 Tax=Parafrankia sp. BMG5.11 TaxID=222540 RepID=UPI0010386DD2|nr:hypothetical protein [Parafrankia sp. BMG5.11]TCJ32164.1 hypothetical protein E0504_44645 [Parafrankia sp. BMG5.11]
MSEIDPKFGPLTLSDLENRIQVKWDEYQATYTAFTVLHRIYMEIIGSATTLLDLEFFDVLDIVRERMTTYQADTRTAYRDTYMTWADAAGVEVPPDYFGPVE